MHRRKRHLLSFPAALLLAGLFTSAGLEAGTSPEPAQQRARAAIDWKLPHAFEEARALAKAENRILLIKGVSFGIDEAGAKCATKGKW